MVFVTNTRRINMQIEDSERTIAGYRALLAVAAAHGMEYEIDRINTQLREYVSHVASLRQQIIEGAR